MNNPNDWTIHQLTIMREAVLSILDEGRLLPDGTRAPWMFYPPNAGEWQPIETAPKTGERIIIGHGNATWESEWFSPEDRWWNMDDNDGIPTHWMPLPKLTRPDWHMDESGDVNEQRTQFCDSVQTYLVKEAQKANVEIIDVKARAF